MGCQDANGNQFGQITQDKSQDYQLIVGYEYQVRPSIDRVLGV